MRLYTIFNSFQSMTKLYTPQRYRSRQIDTIKFMHCMLLNRVLSNVAECTLPLYWHYCSVLVVAVNSTVHQSLNTFRCVFLRVFELMQNWYENSQRCVFHMPSTYVNVRILGTRVMMQRIRLSRLPGDARPEPCRATGNNIKIVKSVLQLVSKMEVRALHKVQTGH